MTARESLSHSSSSPSDQYRTETREAYRNRQRAEAYDRQLLGSLSWARFTMWREIGLVASFIKGRVGDRKPLVIDLPCGTGVAARIFRERGYPVIAGDISAEMMEVGAHRYGDALRGMVQMDITRTPFSSGAFEAAVVLGFLHRIPADLKTQVMKEIGRISTEFVVVSVSVDGWGQRLKRRIVRLLKPGHAFAPGPEAWGTIRDMFEDAGFEILGVKSVMPVLSAEKIVLLASAGDSRGSRD